MMAIKKKATPFGSTKRIIPDSLETRLPENTEEQKPGEPEGQLAVDVFQTPEEIVIVSPLAGVHPKDLSISINENVLSIRGRRSFRPQVAPENFFTKECFWGDFSRSVILPDSVDSSKIRANFRDGILTVNVPKSERIKVRTISIQTE